MAEHALGIFTQGNTERMNSMNSYFVLSLQLAINPVELAYKKQPTLLKEFIATYEKLDDVVRRLIQQGQIDLTSLHYLKSLKL